VKVEQLPNEAILPPPPLASVTAMLAYFGDRFSPNPTLLLKLKMTRNLPVTLRPSRSVCQWEVPYIW